MIDYNDGKWHGWNGGECPVHPESMVEAWYLQENGERSPESPVNDIAYCFDWMRERKYKLVSFRVITPYVEPDPEPAPKPAKRDLRTIDEPFGELDERTQKRLRKAANRGWPVQFINLNDKDNTWDRAPDPRFFLAFAYRLDPTFTLPDKRATFWLTNGRVFQTAREAKTAYPGSDPVKVKECRK